MMVRSQILELLHTSGIDRLVHDLPDAMFVFDLAGSLIYANAQLTARLGVTPENYSLPFGSLVAAEQRDEVRAHFAAVARGETAHYTNAATLPDGRSVRVQVTLMPLLHNDEVVAIVGMARDIEELEASREIRSALESRLESILNSVSDGFLFFSPDWRFTYINPRGEAIVQRSASELIGRSLWEEFPEAEDSGFGLAYRRAVAENHTVTLRDRYEPLGSWLEASAYPTPDGLAVYLRDVTAEEDSRLQLIASESRLRSLGALLDVAHDAIIVRDPHHVIQYWNAAAARIYGWSAEEAIGTSARDLLYARHDEFDEATRRVFADGHWRGELAQQTKWGDTIIADSSWTLTLDGQGEPETLFTVNTNITDRKREEAILLRAQRLDSLGTFAGGLAHDLNNVLTPILTSAQLLAEQEADPLRQRLLSSIESSALRGAEMIRQVLSFARGVESKRVPVDLRELLAEFRELCTTTLPKNIALSITISDRAKNTVGDRTQLLQVLMNLAANARDAMPDGGTLSVSTHSERVGRSEAERHRVAPGRFVIITVEDTGVGMTPATIARLFEPFFTTKSAGSGTGLGLPTSLAIITGHGGFLQVYSEPHHGSRFEMHLPSTAPTSSPADTVDDEDPPGRGNGELIVVVDDEKEIRDATSRALKSHGYTVAAVGNGQEALDFITAHSDVALVVTDLMMPVMDGATLAASLAQSSPRIPIVAMSGLAGNADRADVTTMSAFLAKPFSTADLIRTVSHWVSPAKGDANG